MYLLFLVKGVGYWCGGRVVVLKVKQTTSAMNLLNSLFSKKNAQGLKISKMNEDWVVLKEFDIVYMGSKSNCENYLDQMAAIY